MIAYRPPAANPDPDTSPNDGAPDVGQSMPQADSPLDPREQMDKEELFKRFVEWFKASRDHFQSWRQEAATCYDFVAGHQWSEEDLEILRDQGRPAVTFNRIGPFVDGVSGLEIGNRQTTQFYPRTLGEAGADELLTSAGQWARDECDAEDEESEALRDVIICGVGWTQSRMDYACEPDGMIVIDRTDPLEIYPDPSSRKQNYADGGYVIRVKDIPVTTAERMFPGIPAIDLHAQWAEDQPDETRQPHNARLAPYYRIDQAGEIDRQRMQCRMVEVEWWDEVPAWRVLDPATGRFVRLGQSGADIYRKRAAMLGERPTMLRDRERRYYKAIVGNVVLKVMRGPDKGGFSYKAITGKRDRNKGYWFGLVRAMMDPQQWANKFFTQALHIINTNAKGGLLAETDAFVDIEEARDSWADADSIIELNQGGLQKVQQKNPPPFPAQINAMMETSLGAIPATAGVNLEMIAQQQDQNPGVLEMQRKQQGMTVLAYIFNSMRRYKKEQGRLMIWMLQTFINDGRLIRIGGPDQAQYVPFIHDPGLAEYDVIVDDAPSSPNMKERVWAMIMQMFPMLSRLPLPPAAMVELMRYSPFPTSLTAKLAQFAQQPPVLPPAMQSKQAVDQAQAARHSAEANLLNARAAKEQAETQMIVPKAAVDANAAVSEQQERAARVENLKASAIASLAKVGLGHRTAGLDEAKAAIDSLLQAMQQGHDQQMDLASHAFDVHQAMNPAPPTALPA
ncbi:MAG: hypothetical protein KGL39_24170 [Patescibacteria group bacterium]|nr:hypothetical protein [Patescibacteria group bacterium]